MADRTGIEWTDATWNPVRGCTRKSEGCRECYAEVIAARFSGPGQPYHGFADRDRAGSKWTGKVEVVWPLIDMPLRWRRPRRIFVNSMSDLFHEALPVTEIATVFAVMVAAVHLRGHTLQVLTKRPDRMRALLLTDAFWDQVNAEAIEHVVDRTDCSTCRDDYGPGNPPPGIWLGTSVENQAAYDARCEDLCHTPAAVRFLSCEPLLGPIDLHSPECRETGGTDFCAACFHKIDWLIAGGESGPRARPMHPDWARGLRDRSAAANIPFFFKQNGEFEGGMALRVGKKRAGNLLDGVLHQAFPTEAAE